MSATSNDPYVYRGTETLKNAPDIRDPEQLEAYERGMTFARRVELSVRPISGRFDAAHLKAIHKHLFQDVYLWAGEFRITDLRKVDSPLSFVPPEAIESETRRIFDQLRGKNYLRGLPRDAFAREVAQVFTEVNNTHPFREGNGRTQRVFLSQLAADAGHELHFDVVSEQRMVLVSIAGHQGDLSMATRLFDEISDAARIEPLRRAVTFLERSKFDWSSCYIATTTPGQSYTGQFVGRDNDAFMMRTTTKLFVGHSVDVPVQLSPGSPVSFIATTAPGHTPVQQVGPTDRNAAAGRRPRRKRGICN